MTEWNNRKICPLMTRTAIGDPNPIGFGVRQFIGSIFRNNNTYDVCLCEIKCYEEKCMFWESGSKIIPSRCKLVDRSEP
jgi:hypothetical protein